MKEPQGGKSMFLSMANCGLNSETPLSKCLPMPTGILCAPTAVWKNQWGACLIAKRAVNALDPRASASIDGPVARTFSGVSSVADWNTFGHMGEGKLREPV